MVQVILETIRMQPGSRHGAAGNILMMKPIGIVTACLCVAAAASALLAASGDPAKGKKVFEACTVCHNADSTETKMGPGLKGLFKRDKLKSGKKVTEANVRARIDEGGNGMPGYKDMLTDGEKNDLIAYLKTL
jgi:mono/diheme cytochrome c family protein